MFERFSESARKALFFARFAAVKQGSDAIEPFHLVVGAWDADPGSIMPFVRGGPFGFSIEIEERKGYRVDDSLHSREVPLSEEVKRVLEHAKVEADNLGDPMVRPVHLVLAVMVKTEGETTRWLHGLGLDVAAIRQSLAGTVADEGSPVASAPETSVASEYTVAVREVTSVVWRDVEKAARELTDDVNTAMVDGWQPQGGIASIQAGAGVYLIQAMVKRR